MGSTPTRRCPVSGLHCSRTGGVRQPLRDVSRPWLGGQFGVSLGDLVAVTEQFGDQGRWDLGDEVLQRGVAAA